MKMSKLQETENELQKTAREIKFWGLSLFLLFILFSSSSVSAQQSFDKFLLNFKKAVVNNDKKSVVRLTNFPLSYVNESTAESGEDASYLKQAFLDEYANIFDKSRRQCFRNSSFTINQSVIRESKSIECEGSRNERGIVYGFSKTKSGWKFSNIAYDNNSKQ